MSYIFKTYIAEGREYFVYGEDSEEIKKDFPFSESLMRILDLDTDRLETICHRIDRAWYELCREKEQRFADVMLEGLDELAQEHLFFEVTRMDWRERLSKAREKNYERVVDLPHKKISWIPAEIQLRQSQITEILRLTLDVDIGRDDPRRPAEKLAAYFRNEMRDPAYSRLKTFDFEQLPTKYEPTEHGFFSEVLYPTSVYDLIDFYLRENIRREQNWRVCKNCKRYFPMTGRVSAEYCDRPITASGSTCKDLGSTKIWEARMRDEESFKNYRREYKRRYAWIRLGKWTAEEFADWSARAQKKKTACDSGAISEEEFAAWLKNS